MNRYLDYELYANYVFTYYGIISKDSFFSFFYQYCYYTSY